MLLKIDLQKAFDKIEWSYKKDTLDFFGFPTNVTKLIMSCITTSRVEILLNGYRTDFFQTSRGIW